MQQEQQTQDIEEKLPWTNAPQEGVHACEMEITFATDTQAEIAMKVMQVDPEPTTRVTKSFRLESINENGKETVAMVVRFESKELKMLRVAVSSFSDFLVVVMKTMQEFDETVI